MTTLEVPESPFILEGEGKHRTEWVLTFGQDGLAIDPAEFEKGIVFRTKLLPDNVPLTRYGKGHVNADGKLAFEEELFGVCEVRTQPTDAKGVTQ